MLKLTTFTLSLLAGITALTGCSTVDSGAKQDSPTQKTDSAVSQEQTQTYPIFVAAGTWCTAAENFADASCVTISTDGKTVIDAKDPESFSAEITNITTEFFGCEVNVLKIESGAAKTAELVYCPVGVGEFPAETIPAALNDVNRERVIINITSAGTPMYRVD